jgi:hypothetical protein
MKPRAVERMRGASEEPSDMSMHDRARCDNEVAQTLMSALLGSK